jgi:PilZ domain
MRDRRFEPRHYAHDVVELRWEGSGAAHECPGFLRDLSRSGARVESERSIEVQTPVQIVIRNQKRTARVTFCIRTPTGFMVGLDLTPHLRNSL